MSSILEIDNTEDLKTLIDFDETIHIITTLAGFNALYIDLETTDIIDTAFIKKINDKIALLALKQDIISQPNNIFEFEVCCIKNGLRLLFPGTIHNNNLTRNYLKKVFNILVQECYIKKFSLNQRKGCHKVIKNKVLNKIQIPEDIVKFLFSNIENDFSIPIKEDLSSFNSVQKACLRINLTNSLFSYLQNVSIPDRVSSINPGLKEIAGKYKNKLNIPLIGTFPNTFNESTVYLLSTFDYSEKLDLSVNSNEIVSLMVDFCKNDEIFNSYLKRASKTGNSGKHCYVHWIVTIHPLTNKICTLFFFTFNREITFTNNQNPLTELRSALHRKHWKYRYFIGETSHFFLGDPN